MGHVPAAKQPGNQDRIFKVTSWLTALSSDGALSLTSELWQNGSHFRRASVGLANGATTGANELYCETTKARLVS